MYPGLYIVTGFPGSGKSEFFDHICMNLSLNEGWTHAVCSIENPVHMHMSKLAEKYIGKPFFGGAAPRMSADERDKARSFINDHYLFFDQRDDESLTIDAILERGKEAVMRLGVKTLTIDPYNYLEKSNDCSETDYVSVMLSKARKFSAVHGVAVIIVAHPQKVLSNKDGVFPVPNGMTISGSAHWFNKADFGVTVHRPLDGGVEVHTWKVRFKWQGERGVVNVGYDITNGRYYDPTTTRAPTLPMAPALPKELKKFKVEDLDIPDPWAGCGD
jgi:twinkle protein